MTKGLSTWYAGDGIDASNDRTSPRPRVSGPTNTFLPRRVPPSLLLVLFVPLLRTGGDTSVFGQAPTSLTPPQKTPEGESLPEVTRVRGVRHTCTTFTINRSHDAKTLGQELPDGLPKFFLLFFSSLTGETMSLNLYPKYRLGS